MGGRNRSKTNTPKVMSPEPFIQVKAKNAKVMSPEPKDQQTKAKSPKPTVIATVENAVQLKSSSDSSDSSFSSSSLAGASPAAARPPAAGAPAGDPPPAPT